MPVIPAAAPMPSTGAGTGAPAAPPLAAQIVTCPGCGAKMRARPELGPQIRCPRCKTVISLV
jgi:hypothetical protein